MIVGIDLGTTNSAIAVWLDGRPQLVPNSLGSFLTPSAVSVDEDGQVLVGLAARERQVTHPKVTATTFKRWMGTERVTSLGSNRTFRPEELSALAWSEPQGFAAAKDAVADKKAEARMKGYVGEACPECANFTLVRNGTCLKCDTCGATTGCS